MIDLRGAQVFLSSSFPSGKRGDRFAPYDADAIAGAVTAVARAVLLANGHLVFGAHPTISPLVLLVASELDRQGTISIFQSTLFEDVVPPETLRLAGLGLGELRWVEADPSSDREKSLYRMRREMLADERLVAGVFVGGMEGVLDEYELLREFRPHAALLPLRAPGGAARQLEAGEDPVSQLLAGQLDSDRYPAVARKVVAAVAGTALA